jgi:2-desacetyl-2-hydroxyethyl bacteriochlorophyllide A dehydrogenase
LVEPLAIARHGIRRAHVQPGEQVLVIGAGPIGMGLAVFAKIAGAIVTMMDVRDDRLAFCKEKLGIDQVVNAVTEDASAAIHSFTQGDMCSVVIDATGNLKAINNALQYLAHAGRYVLVGLQKEAFSFSHPDFHKRETTLMSSRNATKEDFEYVMDAIQQGKVNAHVFITHRTSFATAKADFERLCDPASEVVKAVIEFD